MLRIFILSLLASAPLLPADQPSPAKLAAPASWGGETIRLPPGFAPDMKLTGLEHIRFAPGMMNPDSDSFFCYAFVFQLQPQPALTDAVVKDEFLKYYRGLCKAVLKGQPPEVDMSTFTLKLERVKSDARPSADDEQDAPSPIRYTSTLDWVEPFATKQRQKLNLEIWTWTQGRDNYIFACVSPQPPDKAIWKQLRAIRQDYLKRQLNAPPN